MINHFEVGKHTVPIVCFYINNRDTVSTDKRGIDALPTVSKF
jgi:hypothetical protein